MINPEKIDNIGMFDYDISKIFEKSLSYRVEIQLKIQKRKGE